MCSSDLLKGAAESVETRARIAASTIGAVLLAVAGAVWISDPDVPGWWPLAEGWWLPGGAATGITQIASAVIAVALLVYSYRRFHGKPDAVAALEREIDQADEDFRTR